MKTINKKIAIRILKLVKLHLYVCSPFVCVAITRVIRLHQLEGGDLTSSKLMSWISFQLECDDDGDEHTFSSYCRSQDPLTYQGITTWVQARKDWVDLMIVEIKEGRFDYHNKTPINNIVKRLKDESCSSL